MKNDVSVWLTLMNAALNLGGALPAELVNQSRPFLGSRGQGFWGMGQINPAAGHVASNARQIQHHIIAAEALGLDGIVFPELSLMGYPIGDIILRYPDLVAQQLNTLSELALLTKETVALVGIVEPIANVSPTAKAPYYNSVAILHQGEIKGVVRKHLLPNYNEYYDARTFQPDTEVGIQPWQHKNTGHTVPTWDGVITGPSGAYGVGLSICYDWWFDPNTHPNQTCPIQGLLEQQPNIQLLINASASPSRSGKQATRQALFQNLAQKYQRPLLYVNQCGAIDEHSYDGASCAVAADGTLISRAPSFESALWIANPFTGVGVVAPSPEEPLASTSYFLSAPDSTLAFDATHAADLERTYHSVVQGIRDYFTKTGFQRAVLGLSGGLDSSLVAALACHALGPQNVLGVRMPSPTSSDGSLTDAEDLAQRLGMPIIDCPIAEPINVFESTRQDVHAQLSSQWPLGAPSFAGDNIQAMSRASVLRVIGNDYRALPLATSDKSELYLGYATVNGDMSGALSPLGDVLKTKVRALGAWLNAKARLKGAIEPIPEAILTKPSGAELAIDPKTGRHLTAEDALMPYELADELIWRVEAHHATPQQLQTMTLTYETRYTVAPEQKQAWLDIFFTRVERAAFKWWVAPPMIIVDGSGSLAHSDYRHPVTAKIR
ncbi:MAG: NAD(+) synthase [Vampirovibrionales bacterium]|nr:NAD(+) synthase [Vampirovibrionales bacterium]